MFYSLDYYVVSQGLLLFIGLSADVFGFGY